MKKIILFSIAGLILASFIFFGFAAEKSTSVSKEIKWYTLEEAMQANQKNPKKIFIDFYTDWCGWCKVMDKKTFTDAEVIQFMNQHFYAVKFDAEQKTDITFKGKKYNYVPAGRRGIHTLAYTLLDQRASYPSFVILNKDLEKTQTIKGYKTPEQFLGLLKEKAM